MPKISLRLPWVALLLPIVWRAPARAAADPAPAPAAAAASREGEQELAEELLSQGDQADPKKIDELASLRTREALDGLLAAYDAFETPYMKREVLRALPQFDSVAGAEIGALQKLADVATGAAEPALREAALEALGRCTRQGRVFLRLIVESPAASEVREKALELHVALSDETDAAWYRELWKPAEEKAPKDKERRAKLQRGKKGKDGEEEAQPPRGASFDSLRGLAFEALLPSLSADELVEAAQDATRRVRTGALLELERRGDKRALELASAAFQKRDEATKHRVAAAGVLARLLGPKAAPEMIKRALAFDSAAELRMGLADALIAMHDAEVEKDLVEGLGKGQTHEKLFSLYAVRTLEHPDIEKKLLKLLADKDPVVVVEACRTLGFRKDASALPALQTLVAKSKEREVVRAAIDATVEIQGGGKEVVSELLRLARHEDPEIRSMALVRIGELQNRELLPELLRALDDPQWPVRFAALRALEGLRTTDAIGPLIERLAKEEGRLRVDFGAALFRLTGQDFGGNAEGWRAWWSANAAGFAIRTPEEIAAIERAAEDRLLRQTTRVRTAEELARTKQESQFFGIRIVSHRVIFVMDVSGSMDEALAQPYEGRAGLKRMDAAIAELSKCVEALDETAFFNIVTFSTGVSPWREEGMVAATSTVKAEAKAFLEDDVLPFGGTNIYGALRAAFDDPDVDTVVFLSDGEPSEGQVTEPFVIRERVKQWNEHRGIVIHTIGLGGTFQVLEWLAEDSGGDHVRFE